MRNTAMLDFPVDEYEVRLSRLREQMAEQHVDGVLLTQEENLRYFCGFRTVSWESKLTPVASLVVALDGRIALVCPQRLCETAALTSCINKADIHGFVAPFTYADAICDAVKKLNLQGKVLGFEAGMIARVNMDYRDYLSMRSQLSDTEFSYFARYIWKVRSIKSAREIELYRKLSDISGKCYKKAFESVVLDKTTEKEVYHIFAEEAFKLGADSMPPLIVQFGKGRYIQANCQPSDKVITSKEHEFLFLDTGPAMKGYISDTIRMAVVGGMSKRQMELRQMADEALQFCLDMIHDGVPCYEVSAKMDAMVEAKGFGPWNQTKGWTGHGLGLDVHEPPVLSCDCDVTIRKNMILSVEPLMMDAENGIIATEHNILVTENGYENLTPWLSDMVIL